MSLPFASMPHVLSSDDVFPAELAQRTVDRYNDARDAFAVEHEADGTTGGRERSTQIAVASACLVFPSSASGMTDGEAWHLWDPVGFTAGGAPQLTGGAGNWYVDFVVSNDYEWFGCAVTVRYNSATLAQAWRPKVEHVIQPGRHRNSGRLHLGAFNAGSNAIKHVLLVVFGERV